ncbi:MAG: hypothetical protein J6R85_06125 [Lentisphaeria bacterium]|nr:hypothetical protein [Lentisphaeria bacterium]
MKTEKRFFNLIEIALAMAVIALGLSSIMVLYPVGLNATNEATADNVAPDAVAYLMSYLEAGTQVGWIDSDGKPVASGNNFLGSGSNALIPEMDRTNPSPNDFFEDDFEDDVEYPAVDKEEADAGKVVNLSQGKKGSAVPGLFKYEQSYMTSDDERVVDFSAIMRVWRDDDVYVYPNNKIKVNENTAVALNIEISYPAEKPYSAREKQLYRLELFNQAKEK